MGATISQAISQTFPSNCVTRGAAIKINVQAFNIKTSFKCYLFYMHFTTEQNILKRESQDITGLIAQSIIHLCGQKSNYCHNWMKEVHGLNF